MARPLELDGPGDAKALGIETVYQDLSLCMNMDVVANFFMGRELFRRALGFRVLREGEMEAETQQALHDIGTDIPSVRTDVEHLSGGQRQAIELGRFVHWGGKLVLLDEPFAALGVKQTQRGLELINRVKARGIALIVITHNMIHAFQGRRQGRGVAKRAGSRCSYGWCHQPRGGGEDDHRGARDPECLEPECLDPECLGP